MALLSARSLWQEEALCLSLKEMHRSSLVVSMNKSLCTNISICRRFLYLGFNLSCGANKVKQWAKVLTQERHASTTCSIVLCMWVADLCSRGAAEKHVTLAEC